MIELEPCCLRDRSSACEASRGRFIDGGKKGDKALVGNTGYRRFLASTSEDRFAIDYAKAEQDAKFDGVFLLRTNTDLAPLDAMLCYKQSDDGGTDLLRRRGAPRVPRSSSDR